MDDFYEGVRGTIHRGIGSSWLVMVLVREPATDGFRDSTHLQATGTFPQARRWAAQFGIPEDWWVETGHSGPGKRYRAQVDGPP